MDIFAYVDRKFWNEHFLRFIYL